jgi:hypothetical protein
MAPPISKKTRSTYYYIFRRWLKTFVELMIISKACGSTLLQQDFRPIQVEDQEPELRI